MVQFPTTAEETRRWLRVCERNFEHDVRDWWSQRSSIEELDPMLFSAPAAAEDRVYLHEVVGILERLEGPERALWFLENCDRTKDWREEGLTSTERVRLSRMRKRLREELGEPCTKRSAGS